MNYGGNTTVVTAPLATPPFVTPPFGTPTLATPTNLASSISNEGTFIAITGRDFSRTFARLTLDAADFNSSSTTQNSQYSAFTDFQYRVLPRAAALGRIGNQSIQYPSTPAATFVGPTYGRQQGVYGFPGSARYNITPTMLFTASLVQGISSPGQDIGNTPATLTFDPYGSIVDQYSGLPVAFYNQELGLTNNPYRQHLLNFGLTEAIERDPYALYGSVSNQQSLTPAVTAAPRTPALTAPTKSNGRNLRWYRDIKPDLNGYASLGYYNSSNVVTTTSGTPIGSQNNVTASLGVNFSFARNLTGSILYNFSYQTNSATAAARDFSVIVNWLTFQLSESL
jgi:hypothetical protein